MNKLDNVVIVDYGLGNLFSIAQACKNVGINARISSFSNDIEEAKAIILPGVGAFGNAINKLNKLDLVAPIKDFVQSNKPVLGVCLGMQLLFDESEEFGMSKGLGIIPGVIKKFPKQQNGIKNKIPQINWNTIHSSRKDSWNGTLLDNVKEGEYMYFVHSYYAVPMHKENILTETRYNNFNYCSAVNHNNVYAMQFHPEKSGIEGLKIYKNFKRLIQYGT